MLLRFASLHGVFAGLETRERERDERSTRRERIRDGSREDSPLPELLRSSYAGGKMTVEVLVTAENTGRGRGKMGNRFLKTKGDASSSTKFIDPMVDIKKRASSGNIPKDRLEPRHIFVEQRGMVLLTSGEKRKRDASSIHHAKVGRRDGKARS